MSPRRPSAPAGFRFEFRAGGGGVGLRRDGATASARRRGSRPAAARLRALSAKSGMAGRGARFASGASFPDPEGDKRVVESVFDAAPEEAAGPDQSSVPKAQQLRAKFVLTPN